MADARTGGQYSLVRAALGFCLAGYTVWFALLRRPEFAAGVVTLQPWGFMLFCVLALAVVLGRFDRWAGLLLLLLWHGLHGSLGERLDPGVLAVEALLLLNACMPRAPYGSWDARGRVDPAGGWRAPVWVSPLALGALALFVGVTGATALAWGGFDALALLSVVGAPLLFVPRTRPWAWSALLLASLAGWALSRSATGFALPLAFLFTFDPAWIAPAQRSGPTHLFYDGSCALCHGFVRFVMAEDRAGVVRFAPLAGPTFAARLDAERRARLPDSVVVLDEAGNPLVRSQAVRHVLATLGGAWRVLAILQGVFPRFVRDLVYDGVASVRKRVFGTTKDACPLMPRQLGARFDP